MVDFKVDSVPGTEKKPERCFVNIDNTGDGYPEFNIGVNSGTHGDISRFGSGNQTWDYTVLTQKKNCDAFMVTSAEFQISREVLGAESVNLYIGFWGPNGLVDGMIINNLSTGNSAEGN